MYLSDVFTVSLQPGRHVRHFGAVRVRRTGMPVGLQLIGPALGESTILRAAYAYEQATEWHTRRPPL